jgi:hypothetical protein
MAAGSSLLSSGNRTAYPSCFLTAFPFWTTYEDWMICATILAQVSTPRVLFMVMW